MRGFTYSASLEDPLDYNKEDILLHFLPPPNKKKKM